ncbi:MAG: OsmC family protein [Thermoanaerobaculia bacterium]
MSYEVTFPGGVRVDATFRGHTVQTDQPQPYGEDTAMAPFDLFMASLATCAGFYALRFCQQREISTEGLALTLTTERDPEKKMTSLVRIALTTPPGFPEKYNEAIIRAMDQCAVKKHIFDPPQFDITVSSAQ